MVIAAFILHQRDHRTQEYQEADQGGVEILGQEPTRQDDQSDTNQYSGAGEGVSPGFGEEPPVFKRCKE